MPLFRRRPAAAEPIAFSVGVDGHQVIVGSPAAGCDAMYGELDGYIGAIAQRMSSRPDGRDSIAVQNAKMDYVEMSDAAVLVVSLALEDLVDQGLLDGNEIPAKPRFAPLNPDLPTYEYIQATYSRAVQRIAWVREVDHLFRERGIAIVKPAA